ncbi:MAG: GlsB/YeaQ/YmgE family stress response membrane protein [Tissierellia bacterium]|nr:GlsB/YeaQ/YmgE family stress response membrane protein [Tissierellia bacterium]
MGIISWIILGALAGWIASKMMNTNRSMGAFANIAVGIVGALIGGFIMNFFNKSGVYSLNLYSLFVALLGSIILLAIIKAISRK